MAAFSDFLENHIINHFFRNQAYTPAATIYLALFTTATDDTGGGTEVTGGDYARTAVTLSAASGTGGTTSNSADVTFPTATASWGTITHVAIMDASTGGNMLMHGALTTSKAVGIGDTFKIPAGDLDLTVA